jgi:hypothetical protein
LAADFTILHLTKKSRKTRLWYIDDSLFESGPRAGFLERNIIVRMRSLAKFALFALAFAYPTILVTLGLVYGGLVFWTSLAGSMIILWLVLKKTGYARNFEGWDWGYRKFIGLFGAFGIMLGLIVGLVTFGLAVIGFLAAGLGTIFVLGMWRASRR